MIRRLVSLGAAAVLVILPASTAHATVAPPRAGDRIAGDHLNVTLVAGTRATPYDQEHAVIVADAPMPAGVTWIGGHTVAAVFDGLHLLIRGDRVVIGSTPYRVLELHDYAPVEFRQPSDHRTAVVLQTCDHSGPHGEPNPDGRWELYVELGPHT
jgi:hypothetical protein